MNWRYVVQYELLYLDYTVTNDRLRFIFIHSLLSEKQFFTLAFYVHGFFYKEKFTKNLIQ